MTERAILRHHLNTAESIAPPGSQWRHEKTGGLYMIASVALVEATLEIVVVYRSLNEEHVLTFTRPIREFLDGRFTNID